MDARPRRTRIVWAAGLAAAGLTTGLLSAAPAQSAVGDQVADGADRYAVKVYVATGTDDARACSGTLVDPQWVLTAASCFAANPQQTAVLTRGAPPLPAVVTTVGQEPSPTQQRDQKVQEIVPYPDRDLVMARLDSPTADDPLAGPFPEIGAAQVSGDAPAQGDRLRAIGYGRTALEWTPERAHTGAFGVDLVKPTTLAISPAASGGALCKGDAGGPVLNASGRLVAVVSAAWDGGCFNSDETRTGAIATRVDDIAGWIRQVRLTSRQKSVSDVTTAADLNGDGRTDIVSIFAGRAEVFYGRQDGTLEYGTTLDGLVSRGPHKQLFAGDFTTGVGVEIITVWGNGNLRMSKQNRGLPFPFWGVTDLWADPSWQNGLPAATLRTGVAGRDSLVFQWPDGSLYTYTRDAGGNLVNTKKSVWPDKTWKKRHIATGDFNGDGRDDIAAVAADNALHLYPGKPDGTFDKAVSMWPDKTWTTPRPVLGGDFNGDGKADLAALLPSGDLRFYAGDGRGGLAAGKSMWPTV
ncbi:FG-GAP-like repeat-containing protein [Streptomyces hilarionis]|uniref:FG-GAP-like repeat-containing protein n=1 Tax=Streptomyces hilarionis TaxID=2839954 RepID=UPI002119DE3F|nr:FG-GAP-like repeat-containing protein [Streptomyces hilarionis]MCQ9134517.1 VCBS repeat-containing protein [Streptomyces hilarionis]